VSDPFVATVADDLLIDGPCALADVLVVRSDGRGHARQAGDVLDRYPGALLVLVTDGPADVALAALGDDLLRRWYLWWVAALRPGSGRAPAETLPGLRRLPAAIPAVVDIAAPVGDLPRELPGVRLFGRGSDRS
jgi:hypothetical protein